MKVFPQIPPPNSVQHLAAPELPDSVVLPTPTFVDVFSKQCLFPSKSLSDGESLSEADRAGDGPNEADITKKTPQNVARCCGDIWVIKVPNSQFGGQLSNNGHVIPCISADTEEVAA